jgi:hypothetical protein
MTYTRAWWNIWRVLTSVGIGIAVLEWSPWATVACLAVVTICVVLAQQFVWPAHLLGVREATSWRNTVPRALCVSVCVVAELAVTAASAPLGLLTVLLFTLTSPWLMHRLPRRRREPSVLEARPHGPPVADPPAEPTAAADRTIEALDDSELCRLWRGTFWELHTDAPQEAVLAMVALRQRCLDEMEQRNPAAVRAWLNSGARASGGPEKFWPKGPHSGSGHAA